jgi:hypothetical protein
VSGVGDVDEDDIPDIVVGAPAPDSERLPRAYVFSGATGAQLYEFTVDDPTRQFGSAVAGVGDASGDGVADILVGAPHRNSTYGHFPGEAWLYSGADGSHLRTLTVNIPRDHFGAAVGGVGDIDGDGRADLLVGAPYAGGRAYVFAGTPPTVAALTIAPDPAPRDATLTLTPEQPVDPPGPGGLPALVGYFFDADDSGTFDEVMDPLVAEGVSVLDGFVGEVAASDLPTGCVRIFARARSSSSIPVWSNPVAATVEVVPPPGSFQLLSPANGAEGLSSGPTLDWSDAAHASDYLVEIDQTPGFASPAVALSVTDSTVTLPIETLVDGTRHYWRVAARNISGQVLAAPALSSFTTETSAPACTGDIDGDGDTDVLDFASFLAGFNGAEPEGHATADLNRDGAIDILDFAILVGDFGCEP